MLGMALCVALWALAKRQGDLPFGGTVSSGQSDKPLWCWVPDLLWRDGVLMLSVESEVGRDWGQVEICVWCPLPERL